MPVVVLFHSNECQTNRNVVERREAVFCCCFIGRQAWELSTNRRQIGRESSGVRRRHLGPYANEMQMRRWVVGGAAGPLGGWEVSTGRWMAVMASFREEAAAAAAAEAAEAAAEAAEAAAAAAAAAPCNLSD